MKNIFLIAGLLALSLNSFASGEKGNGGYSVVCRDENNFILSAELLDIYEGKTIYKLEYPTAGENFAVDTLLTVAKYKMKEHTTFSSKLEKELALVDQNMLFIPLGNELESTDDAFPVIKRRGCKFEQLANYTDEGELIVSQEIYDELDNVNKAAFRLHEAIYSLRRKSRGDETSEATRRLTAHIMAKNGNQKTIDRLTNESMFQPDVKKLPCGLRGTIEERIESCSYQARPVGGMYLVTRTQDMKEVWKDFGSNLLWSDRLPSKMGHFMAEKACQEKDMPEMAYLNQFKWRLPTSAEYFGPQEFLAFVLPNNAGADGAYKFWTSTVKAKFAMVFNGATGEMSYEYLSDRKVESVRCVTKLR
ncbi:hypothetical protein [Peredibacter starrii]|uniref:DUF1566 domain-containing protein n=1 Tax=Peredibacter starrii TaxID=28202 RepID=A0AAX4HJY3_9BACT|nr:hypothetical protein [Peredibacter starrii]WPU63496.1 hypothetical protein SOO65_12430 [Peredibacter starrii]